MESGFSLAQSFGRYFDVCLAVSEEQKAQVYGVRYRVYCLEFGYEPRECFPDEQESDQFDDRSLHCLITHKSTGRAAGCARLVLGAEQGQMPFEKFCPDTLDQALIGSLDLDRTRVCEISRLAVDGAFRRRTGESETPLGKQDSAEYSQREQRTFPLISVAAFLGATALTEVSGRGEVFAMMEPFLPRLLKRSGLFFQRAGKDVEYHGIRAPYFIRSKDALKTMNADLKELYDSIAVNIRQQYDQMP
ncbi:MAG: PEP-CTERM/exosortase system-associated acyltransferase [Gammaproteobacteria bacterium]|nr:MAG: PEP-CTERM/exosortase system-associated acyltransferase [Pseudomonadota bacterium]PIE38892.1 MAG: PEP-CTERM/exosortase system-associated acyltransferase [Gammaproteobacteria bacterium]